MGRRATLWQVLLIKIHKINGSHVSSRARFLLDTLEMSHSKIVFLLYVIYLIDFFVGSLEDATKFLGTETILSPRLRLIMLLHVHTYVAPCSHI